MRWRILILTALVLSTTLTGCGLQLGKPNPKEKASYDGPEALQWLRQNKNESALASNRFLGTENAVRFVQQLYDAGAAGVIIPNDCIEQEPDGPYADALAVKLPADAEKRKRVWEICAKEIKREGFSPKEQAGEDEIFLWWD